MDPVEVEISPGPEWIHRVKVCRDDWPDMQQWCQENIGEFDRDWYKLGIDPMAVFIGGAETTWYFKQEKHAVLFLLRWA